MKRIFILVLFMLFVGCGSTEQITTLETKVEMLEKYIESLEVRLELNETLIKNLSSVSYLSHFEISNNQDSTKLLSTTNAEKQNKSFLPTKSVDDKKPQSMNKKNDVNTSDGRCQAITKSGTQCSRNAQSGSIYCWQHQGYNGTVSNSSSSSNYSSGKTIYTGPRGGQYYINSKGNKVYIKKKK